MALTCRIDRNLRDDLYSFVISIISSLIFCLSSIFFFLDGIVWISAFLAVCAALFVVISSGVYRNFKRKVGITGIRSVIKLCEKPPTNKR